MNPTRATRLMSLAAALLTTWSILSAVVSLSEPQADVVQLAKQASTGVVR
ncbi:MAG: hypothetical protein ACKVQR_07880 [Aquabacterium sp.]